ncbi:hypothetical protein TUM17571_30410 [Klebsiella pneumoniae]|nr:hypothetical protein TUM17557_30410 [Enterobacter cloacae]GJL08733.1 hypothetical protein TUM17571_30410 [Klebsiella pneumoniae]
MVLLPNPINAQCSVMAQSFWKVTGFYHSACFALTPALSRWEREKKDKKKASEKLAKVILEAM